MDFANAEVVYANLGGQANNVDPEEIYYRGVGVVPAEGGGSKRLNLRVTKTSGDYNCIGCSSVNVGPFGQINMKGQSKLIFLMLKYFHWTY